MKAITFDQLRVFAVKANNMKRRLEKEKWTNKSGDLLPPGEVTTCTLLDITFANFKK